MKRNLFQNVLVMPYKTGDVIDRNGYLSAVVGAVVSSGGSMSVIVEHSEDGENFVPVADERVFPEQQTEGGKFTFKEPVGAEDEDGPVDTTGVVNVEVDLLGLKQFVKLTVEGSDSLAVVLGDSSVQPV